MFIAERDIISVVDMKGNISAKAALTLPPGDFINAIEGDARKQILYYTDITKQQIKSVKFDGTQDNVVCVRIYFTTPSLPYKPYNRSIIDVFEVNVIIPLMKLIAIMTY